MRKKLLAIVLVAALLLPAILSGCAGAGGNTLVVNVGPEPDSIDPANNESVDGATLLIHAFEGLMTLDSNGVPVEGQAESYKVSDDKLTYTFTLRDGLKWSDGKALKASDFIYAWKRAVNPETGAPYGYMFDVIKGYDEATDENAPNVDALAVSAPDDKTVVIQLSAPCPYFLELCAFPIYFPVREDVVAGNEGWATDPKTYITNGPYRLKTWNHEADMTYEQNPYYHNRKALGPDEIKFVLMDDDNAILAAFKNGEIAFADSMPTDEIANLKGTPEYFEKGQLGTYFVCFNTKKAPFTDARVRKALSLVIDRNYIAEKIGQAGQQPAGAFVATGLTDADVTKQFRDVGGDYYSVKPEDYAKNCEEARKLLADAGYPDGKGFPAFEYSYNTGTGHQLVAEALQNMWKEQLGISCTLASKEWSVFQNDRQNGNYDVARHGWLGDYNDPISFLDMWVSDGGNNDADWSNADYDKLIEEVKSSSDKTTRFADMHKAEDILMGEMPVAPIYYYVDLYLKSTKLEGFYSSPLGYKYFMYSKMAQ